MQDMATSPSRTPFLRRLMAAAVLDRALYEEVEADRSATTQAFCIVLLSSCAAGVGLSGLTGQTAASIAAVGIGALMTWGVGAVLTFEIGSQLMPEPTTQADVGELLRT